MPEARLQRTRETLPKGYQFGDTCRDRFEIMGTGDDRWLAFVPSLAHQLAAVSGRPDPCFAPRIWEP